MNTTNTSTAPAGIDPNIKVVPIMVALITGVFFSIMNETLLNVALTPLSEQFDVPHTTIQWLTTGYLLVVGILVPISALLISWFTTRQMFIGGMIIFTIGTLICGFAPNFPVLLIGRLVQATSTGLMLPILMNTILVLIPAERRGSAMGLIGLVIMFAPAIGPTLSGLIVENFGTQWLFFFVVPFALLSIGIAWVYLKNVTRVTKPKINIPSIILSTIGFGGIVFGFSSAEGEAGFAQPQVIVSIVVGAIALAAFIVLQLRLKEPMLDFRTFKYPMFSISTILMVIVMMSMFSTMILLPMLLTDGIGLTGTIAGLALLPGGLLNGLFSPITGRLFDKFGPRALIIPGTIALSIVLFFLSNINADTPFALFVALHIVLMLSISMIMMPTQTNGLNQLDQSLYPHGTAILNTLMQVAGAIGIAFFVGIKASGVMSAEADGATEAMAVIAGTKGAFTIAFVISLLAVVLSFFTKRAKSPQGAPGEANQQPMH
ncbi:MDR family MFS transporter [Aureibacillus halotolerans]|uniref:DHA2 family lincomycin resistance protein-like MFS transporter n=1 Tax=Aureibacillus halotolerans TaxID=1508390 RepID=A0A4R6UD83_9BACI|nr:MDR family MFS transporter [Aureibacillus halotolerans]TDQ41064.1 DHA2 family lincomycin resistance protein-like MFS transporter [Aureibacillus halotolerans]